MYNISKRRPQKPWAPWEPAKTRIECVHVRTEDIHDINSLKDLLEGVDLNNLDDYRVHISPTSETITIEKLHHVENASYLQDFAAYQKKMSEYHNAMVIWEAENKEYEKAVKDLEEARDRAIYEQLRARFEPEGHGRP